jgi:hypothetical protein
VGAEVLVYEAIGGGASVGEDTGKYLGGLTKTGSSKMLHSILH